MKFQFVYKICSKSDWLIAKHNKKFHGTKKDIEDGFIHFSDKKQVQGTLKKHYFNHENLILLKINALKLVNLVWEQASDGNMFPHLYSHLEIASVCDVYDLIMNEDGSHKLPSDY